MRLILIRHAKAGDRDAETYPDDRLRPLTKAGRAEHRIIARALARLDLGVDRILTSPLVRARQTADITAEELGLTRRLDETEVFGMGFSVPKVLALLREYPAAATLACVGHEPDLSTLAATLLHPDGQVLIDFKKSGVLAVDCAGFPARGEGTLVFFLRPKDIRALVG